MPLEETIRFNAHEVRELLKISRRAIEKVPVLQQARDPKFWRRDMPLLVRSTNLEELRKTGRTFSLQNHHIDRQKVPAGLILSDRGGLALISNACHQGNNPKAAYASGMTPGKQTLDEIQDNLRRIGAPNINTTVAISEAEAWKGLGRNNPYFYLYLDHDGNDLVAEVVPHKLQRDVIYRFPDKSSKVKNRVYFRHRPIV